MANISNTDKSVVADRQATGLQPDFSTPTGGITPSGGGGLAGPVSGTANQILVANGAIAPVVSLSTTIIFPGSITVSNGQALTFIGSPDNVFAMGADGTLQVSAELRMNGTGDGPLFGGRNTVSTARFLATDVPGDTNNRFTVDIAGYHSWGSGAATPDTTLYRSGVAALSTIGSLTLDLGTGNGAIPAPPSNTQLYLGNADGSPTAIDGISFGNAAGLNLIGTNVGGSRASQSATTAGRTLVGMFGRGFGSSIITANAGAFFIKSNSLWSSVNLETAFVWNGTSNGSTSSAPWMQLDNANLSLLLGKIITYNAVVTAGWGVPAIYGKGRSAGAVAAVASVAAYTVGAADGSFLVSANILVTASVTNSFTCTCTYTDEGGSSRTLNLSFSQITGTILITITNLTGTGAYEGVPLHIRAKASTAITIATTGTFTSVTYNVEAYITQIG